MESVISLRPAVRATIIIALVAAAAPLLSGCGGGKGGDSGSTRSTSTVARPAKPPPPRRVASFTPEPGDVIGDGPIAATVPATATGATITTYDRATGRVLKRVSDDALSNGCGVALARRSDGVDMLLWVDSETAPNQGIRTGKTTNSFVATNARSGKRLWKVKYTNQEGRTEFAPYTGNNDDPCAASSSILRGRLQMSPDGRAALFGNELIVDLDSGHAFQLSDCVGTDCSAQVAIVGSSFVKDDQKDAAGSGDRPATASSYTRDGARDVVSLAPVLGDCVAAPVDCSMVKTGQGQVIVTKYETTEAAGLEAALPANGKQLWRTGSKTGPDAGARPQPGDAIVLEPQSEGVRATSALTGKRLWEVDVGDYCGTTNGKVFVSANQHLATLDLRTGRQLTYDPAQQTCPGVIPGALAQPLPPEQAPAGENAFRIVNLPVPAVTPLSATCLGQACEQSG